MRQPTDRITPLLAVAILACAALPGAARAAEKSPLVVSAVAFERMEYRLGDEGDLLAWEGEAFVGTDEWKLRLESEGEWSLDGHGFETLESQVLIQRPLDEFFDLKAGLRYDAPSGPNRLYGVLGLSGLARQWVEVEAALFFSEEGGAPSARLELEYELLLTNRIILTPAVEVDFAFADDEEIGVGAGLSTSELGLRLSYDLLYRDVAPYLGLHWEKAYGKTAEFGREEGEGTDELFAVIGVRLRF
ncbi:MAG: copper resistance protein B [Tistlia sp.]|uniref:copper resistance protein B n=1 Tax=Tistlia sp. TaxID=3057121 RepID=UPI0034A20396